MAVRHLVPVMISLIVAACVEHELAGLPIATNCGDLPRLGDEMVYFNVLPDDQRECLRSFAVAMAAEAPLTEPRGWAGRYLADRFARRVKDELNR